MIKINSLALLLGQFRETASQSSCLAAWRPIPLMIRKRCPPCSHLGSVLQQLELAMDPKNILR